MVTYSQSSKLSPNRQAFPIVKKFLDRSELLRVKVHNYNKVTVIDCGVQVQGGWEAGVLFAEVCLGGLARVNLHWSGLNGLRWPTVEVYTDHPVRACLASQYAGWPIQNGKSLAMGSGPGRAIIHKGSVYETSSCYEDYSERAILCLECEGLPSDEVVQHLLKELGCDPKNLYILVAPTASQVGSVQIAARALETGLSKLMELGYDLERVDSGWGTCPLPPVAGNQLSALGRSNDGILYGSTVLYNLRDEDEVLDALVRQIPFCSSKEYGRPFLDIYKDHGNFYDIDPLIFSPAEVWLCNLNSGRSFHAGALRPDLLRDLFDLT
ncbi:methenyltetrahydromethanopterin cyclohydrolase [Desulfosporosinus sp.]|uniref:methenyltetrahydromethanopterin cyclohydrolase n=1 Tax=Desulfosporosinus sp. TaxID=157907 RepID=UPI0025BD4EB3|nr:methenyltetrahydromethanopterin cyclohydrolase [Desulfosporosinus sp.]MBC2723672.1 methenyltetrahydromethanopterin cyclohydrolase [Desulfosporosinus sp.]MBC2726528.1 methenyltetrahydromethanopterin cyclohydrolase [Desulfosporosinus sp.]